MSGQVAGTVALPAGASAVSIVADGLVFEIDDTSKTATLVGSAATPPKGDLSVPASVTSGTTTYEVTSIAKEAFAKCAELTAISLPATLREVDPDAVAGCASLKSITVSAKNEAFVSHDGLLFTKDYTRLLLIPEGMEGAANIPGSTTTVPAQALSRCLLMGSSLTAGDGSAAFTTRNGMLFSKDLKTLVFCPPAIGNAVVLPAETEVIGEYALAGCKDLTSITALGNVREIDATAFAEEVKATAVVALPAGESKAVWEQAGFQHFAEPAEPGATTRPEADAEAASGLVFTLLDDYTLSVTWEGAEDPAANLDIPASAEINGVTYRVSTIATNAFANCGSLTSVKFPASITSIGEAAFAGCANLVDVQLPGNLSEIGERAFEATSLADIWLPASVQSIGSRAFASCDSLACIVALGTPQVANEALASCVNLSIYCPYNAEGTYPWNLGLIANNNHLLPYGLTLPEEPLTLEVGESANLFEVGLAEVPEGCEISYSYAAKPISVDPDGTVTAKALGTSEVTATLTLNNHELARTTRTVQVIASTNTPAQESSQPEALTHQDDSTPNAPTSEAPATLSLMAALTTDQEFMVPAPTGQMLKYKVLASDPTAVEVSWGEDTTRFGANTFGALVIPARIPNPSDGKEYVVKGVPANGFFQAKVTSVTFEEGSQVTYIGGGGFQSCQVMRQISLPNSLQTIGFQAFAYCFGLTSLDVPDSVTAISSNAFQSCMSMKHITLGAGVTSLSSSLFNGDLYLESILVKGDVTNFAPNVFASFRPSGVKVLVPSTAQKTAWEQANTNNAYGLNPDNIIVADSLLTVTFKGCGDYEGDVVLRVPQGSTVEEFSVVKQGFGIVGWYEESSPSGEKWDFSQPIQRNVTLCPRWMENVVVDDLVYSMRSSGGLAVAAVDALTVKRDVYIPDEVTIGDVSYPVTAIANRGFANTDIDSIRLPSGLERFEDTSLNGSTLPSIDLASLTSLKEIGISVFGNSNLSEVVIPASVETLKRATFHTSKSLKSVTFAEGSRVTDLPDECFNNCANLESVTLPAGLMSMQYYAFNACSSLTSIDLPEGLEYMGVQAFANCPALRSMELPSTVTTVEASAFANDTALLAVALPSGLQKLGSNAFKGCTALNALSANSSMSAIADALKPSSPEVDAFAGLTKANISVVLPASSEDGSEMFDKMKDSWEGYGFTVASLNGDLPTEDGQNNAHWELTSDGTLRIWSDRQDAVVQNLGWSWKEWSTGHWGPVRPFVKKVVMDANLDALDIDFWFAEMPGLLDISGVRIPASAQSAHGAFAYNSFESLPENFSLGSLKKMRNMFHSCSSLKALPEGLIVPDDANDLQGMFINCSSLESIGGVRIPRSGTNVNVHGMLSMTAIASLPEDFTVPDSVTRCNALFDKCTNLVSLPDGFRLSNNITVEKGAEGIFSECTSLERLPEGFVIPDNITSTYGMFLNCSSLTSLPAGLKIPSKANLFAHMFEGCTSLASLPADFDMPTFSVTPDWLAGVFAVEGPAVPIFYSGNNNSVKNFPWGEANRTLVTSASKLQGSKTVALNFISPDSPAGGSYWTTAYTDGSGLLTEPAAVPSRVGHVFTLWYADPDCTQRVDFSQPFEADTTIYGKLAPGTREGELPCEAGSGSAFWSLTDDGTLCLRGSGTIVDFGRVSHDYDNEVPTEGYWAPYRESVKKVSMQLGLKAKSTREWFSGMTGLVDASEICMPIGTENASKMFFNCSSLTSLSGDFTLPNSLKLSMRMFGYTSSLTSLPNGFTLSDALSDANSMFLGSGLRGLPESMTLPRSLRSARLMFASCRNLASLSSGMVVPEGSNVDLAAFLSDCRSLVALPENFTVPNTLQTMNPGMSPVREMLRNCLSLTSLPDGFDVPEEFLVVEDNPFFCDIPEGSPRVAMYYSGSSKALLNFDWESQNRTLITKDADAEGFGMQQAVFKMQVEQPDGSFAWETRSTAWSNKQGILADPGMPVHPEGYKFTGWCTDETCLTSFDFTKPLPERTTLYGKWIKHGGRGSAEGMLPVEPGTGEAWWQITADDTLMIQGEGRIQKLWEYGNDPASYSGSYWGPYRGEVSRVIMGREVRTIDMECWFADMTLLTNLEGIFIPEDCTNVRCLFFRLKNLKELPVGFSLPGQLVNIQHMFGGCGALESLPEGFTIPQSVTEMSWLFNGCLSLKTLPASFSIPERATSVGALFRGCSALVSLPENFRLPNTSGLSVGSMFDGCSSLTALPEGFTIPQTIQNWEASPETELMNRMFWGCDSLTRFPDSFDFPVEVAKKSAEKSYYPFKCTAPTETLYEGSAAWATALDAQFWSDQNRTLVTSTPQNRFTARFMLPDEKTGTFGEQAWIVVTSDANGLVAEVPVPPRKNATFVGWYTTSKFEAGTEFNFKKPLTSNVVLYAKYQENKGTLPTTDGGERAFWELTDDGTLRISCEPGATIADFGWINDFDKPSKSFLAMHWGPVRDKVKNVVMEKGLLAESMDFWFTDMSQLKDCSEVFVPEGVTSLHSCFKNTGIEAIPEGFVIPNTVENLHDCFFRCEKLSKIAEDFSIPNSVTEMGGTFVFCSSLTSLPSGFQLPENLEIAANLFRETGLTTFPEGFTLPATVTDASFMVYRAYSFRTLPASFLLQESATGAPLNCRCMFKESGLMNLPPDFTIPARVIDTIEMFRGTQLTSLPEGFAIEGTPTSVQSMFMNCPKLTYLPASLKLTPLRDAGVYTSGMFGWLPDEPGYTKETIATYYAGDDPEVLRLNTAETASVYWKNKFNRTLLWNGAGSQPLPDKTLKVSFQLQKPDATQPTEWMTVLATAGEDGVTRVAKPEEPSEFGYVFDGWYTDASFAAESKFSFGEDGTAEVASDLPLYGRYTLCLSYDIPVTAKVTVDSSGNVEADAIQMKSFTPKTLEISSVSAAEAPGAVKLFPKASERSKVKVVVDFGQISYRLKLEDSLDGLLGKIPAATPSEPGVLDGQLSIDRDNAQINFQPGEDITSFAKLTWTIEPKL